ncbi:hypothetical protein [Mycobacterium marinum]|uniref:hypothetical protein n=1 Tax=Mycobacterium marinum TaxID=1781 RepID=UPI000B9689BE|nr:hypothetical protein [Mycobacterium marinum]
MMMLATEAAAPTGESWTAVAISLVTTLGVLVGIYLKQRAEIASVRGVAEKVDRQVTNAHGDRNLRDQLDAMHGLLTEIDKKHTSHSEKTDHAIGELRSDVDQLKRRRRIWPGFLS